MGMETGESFALKDARIRKKKGKKQSKNDTSLRNALNITDHELSDGVQLLFCVRIRPNLVDALLPNSNVLFTFRSALHEHRGSESCRWVFVGL
jgi:hypothetical protein